MATDDFKWYLQFMLDNTPWHINIYNYNFIFSCFIRYNWKIKYTYLKHMMPCFDIHIHYKMITTIKLINMSITHIVTFFSFLLVVVRTLKIYFLCKLQVCNTLLLTIVALLYITTQELIHILTESLCPLTNISPLLPNPGKHHSTPFLWV